MRADRRGRHVRAIGGQGSSGSFETPALGLDLPVDVRGTVFEKEVDEDGPAACGGPARLACCPEKHSLVVLGASGMLVAGGLKRMNECKHGLKTGCSYCHGTATSSPRPAVPEKRGRATRLADKMNDRMSALIRRLRVLRGQ
jgi:hypothetical protein